MITQSEIVTLSDLVGQVVEARFMIRSRGALIGHVDVAGRVRQTLNRTTGEWVFWIGRMAIHPGAEAHVERVAENEVFIWLS